MRQLGQWVVGLGLLLVLWGCQPAPTPQGDRVRITKAVSGMTLEVLPLVQQTLVQQTQAERIRLIGLDAPAFDQNPWNKQAQTYLQTLTLGKTVLLEPDIEAVFQPKQGVPQKLAYVWLDGTLLNEKMIAEGYVLAGSRSPNLKYDQRLTRAQESARLRGIGIWNPNQPMRQTPGEFRKDEG